MVEEFDYFEKPARDPNDWIHQIKYEYRLPITTYIYIGRPIKIIVDRYRPKRLYLPMIYKEHDVYINTW